MPKFNGWAIGRGFTDEEADALEPFVDVLSEALETARKMHGGSYEPATLIDLIEGAKKSIEVRKLQLEAGISQDWAELELRYIALATLVMLEAIRLRREHSTT